VRGIGCADELERTRRISGDDGGVVTICLGEGFFNRKEIPGERFSREGDRKGRCVRSGDEEGVLI